MEYGRQWYAWKARSLVEERQIISLAKPVGSIVPINRIEFIQPYERYHSFNMSVIDHNDKITACFRNSNFLPKSKAHGKNSFLALADLSDNKISNVKEIHFRGFTTRMAGQYNAMEDPRLIYWKGDIWCLFIRPNRLVTKIYPVLMNLRNKDAIFLDDPDNRPFSKNWMPFVENDRLFLITDLNPFRVYELVNKNLKIVKTIDNNFQFLVHGGSNIITVGDRRVGLVHGRFEYEPEEWFYWHAVASWDCSWNEMKIGKFFYFEKIGIEFSLSIMHKNDNIYIPYSVDDISMGMISMDISDFEVLI